MQGDDLLALVIGGAILSFGWWQMPRRWRGDLAISDLNAGSWFLPGMTSRRALRRSIPAAMLGLTLGYFAGILSFFMDGLPIDQPQEFLFLILVVPALLAIFAMIPISLFNRPRFAVPPSLRGEPGIITGLFKRRSRTSARRR